MRTKKYRGQRRNLLRKVKNELLRKQRKLNWARTMAGFKLDEETYQPTLPGLRAPQNV